MEGPSSLSLVLLGFPVVARRSAGQTGAALSYVPLLTFSPAVPPFFLGSRRGGKLGMGGHGGRRGRGSSGGSGGHGGLLELGVIREMWAGSGDHGRVCGYTRSVDTLGLGYYSGGLDGWDFPLWPLTVSAQSLAFQPAPAPSLLSLDSTGPQSRIPPTPLALGWDEVGITN